MVDTSAPAERQDPPREHVGSAVLGLLRALLSTSRHFGSRLRTWNARGGAGASGLAALAETHALQTAGDATITVALAGSLFFSVPTHEARSRVALYLLVTMAPFAVVAPILGPLLDRFRRGRRTALAVTMFARAGLAIAIGHSLSSNPSRAEALALYPAALLVLVSGKAYSIIRSATVPRLVPPGMTLVQANARLTLIGAVMPGVAGGIAVALVKSLGHHAELDVGAVVYALAAINALRLPSVADGGDEVAAERPAHGGLVRHGKMGVDVEHALRTTAALRWLGGFLLLYGAFVVREHPIGGLNSNVSLAALAVGIGAGNVLGTTIGPRTASLAATRLSIILLGATVIALAIAAFDFGLISVFTVAVVGSGSAAVAKLALDATIQRRVDDAVRTSTFARSETTLQLSWVVGGGIGIVLPTQSSVGFSIATAVLLLAFFVALRARPFNAVPKLPPMPDAAAFDKLPATWVK